MVTVEIPEPGHVHDDPLKKVEEKPATCTQEGNKAYYVCESCGTWFEDAAGEKPITDHDSVILPKTEHTPSDWKADADNHWKECTECTETIAGSLSAHSFEWIIDREATATEDGSKHEECSVCGYAKEPVRIPPRVRDRSILKIRQPVKSWWKQTPGRLELTLTASIYRELPTRWVST